MSQDDQQTILIGAIHQLLRKLEANCRGSSKETVANVLAHLETTDADFNSYSFVKILRSRIDVAIGEVVDSKLESMVLKGDGHDVVPKLMDDVLSSQKYLELYDSILTDLKAAVDSILNQEVDTIFTRTPTHSASMQYKKNNHRLPYTVSSTSSSGTHFLNLDDSLASGFSSHFNQTGLLFLTPDQLEAILRGMEHTDSIETKMESLKQLLHFPPGDALSKDCWPRLKRVLLSTLADTRLDLSVLALKFLAKMLSEATSQNAKEGFTILIDHLVDYYKSCDTFPVAMVTGIDLQDEECAAILKRFRLVREFSTLIPNYWLRCSSSLMELMISRVMFLLSEPSSASPSTTPVVTPLHFFALLDPTAVWFRKWMHGHYSRSEVLLYLKNHPKVLEECVRSVVTFDDFIKSCASQQPRRKGNSGSHYSEEEITFALFVHSLSVIERVLLYRDGWKVFPVSVEGLNGAVKPSDLLVHLIHLVFTSHFQLSSQTLRSLAHPHRLIFNLFGELALSSAACKSIICQETVIEALIHPLKAYLSQNVPTWKTDANKLVFVADILALIASQENGRHFLLYGNDGRIGNINHAAGAHTIAQFTVCALQDSLTPSMPKGITEAFLFVCRQLYNTCEGLFTLKEYTLHKYIASAWNKKSTKRINEESLLDNMLNFAATPRGVLLLHQTGGLLDCVDYMLLRYKMKLQVSKCQKFGYGCMVTQIASTAVGMKALLDSGFVAMFLDNIWSVLEEGDDERLLMASHGPLDPTDRVVHKALINLLNVLSSFPAVAELVSTCAEEGGSDCRVLQQLLDLLLWNRKEDTRELIHPDYTHLCGLRVLNILVASLDTFLLLETQYNLTGILLDLQEDNRINSRDFIIDAHSVLQNRILVSVYCPGGPNERNLPIINNIDQHSLYLFSKYPPPKTYWRGKAISSGAREAAQLKQFIGKHLPESPKDCESWLQNCKSIFIAALKAKQSISTSLMYSVIVKSTKGAARVRSALPQLVVQKVKGEVQPVDELGARLTLRYARQFKLLDTATNSLEEEELAALQLIVRHMVKEQQHKGRKLALGYLAESYPGFDWVVATLYVMSGGKDKKNSLLEYLCLFSSLLQSCYIWPQRMYKSVHLPPSVAASGVPVLVYGTAHNVELLLEAEVPLVYSAFKMSGYTPGQIVQHWLTQSFWNFLDWEQITLYLTLCILLGPDYQVYICMAIFTHLEKNILKHVQEQNLLAFLKEEPIHGFCIQDYLSFMNDLKNKYQSVILEDMKNFSML